MEAPLAVTTTLTTGHQGLFGNLTTPGPSAHTSSARSIHAAAENEGLWAVLLDPWEAMMICALTLTLISLGLFWWSEQQISSKVPVSHLLERFRCRTRILPPFAIIFATCVMAIVRIWTEVVEACAQESMQADIGGDGVIVTTYLMIYFIALTLVVGHRCKKETSTKEVGMAVLGNVVYLLINLSKSYMNFSTMSYADRLIAFMTIDASHTAVTMSLCNKQALASRTYVALCNVILLISFCVTVVGMMLAGIEWHHSNHSCHRQVWWSVLSSDSMPGPSFWLYHGVRLMLWAHRAWRSRDLAAKFDIWKKVGPLSNEDSTFDSLYATTTHHCVFDFPFLVVNTFSLGFVLRRLRLSHTNTIADWGQSAQLFTCLYSASHSMYIYSCNFNAWANEKAIDTSTLKGRTCQRVLRNMETVRDLTKPLWCAFWNTAPSEGEDTSRHSISVPEGTRPVVEQGEDVFNDVCAMRSRTAADKIHRRYSSHL